jgi:hypothetical protein
MKKWTCIESWICQIEGLRHLKCSSGWAGVDKTGDKVSAGLCCWLISEGIRKIDAINMIVHHWQKKNLNTNKMDNDLHVFVDAGNQAVPPEQAPAGRAPAGQTPAALAAADLAELEALRAFRAAHEAAAAAAAAPCPRTKRTRENPLFSTVLAPALTADNDLRAISLCAPLLSWDKNLSLPQPLSIHHREKRGAFKCLSPEKKERCCFSWRQTRKHRA